MTTTTTTTPKTKTTDKFWSEKLKAHLSLRLRWAKKSYDWIWICTDRWTDSQPVRQSDSYIPPQNFIHRRYKYHHTYQHFRKKQSKTKQKKYFDNHLATCFFLQKQCNLSSFLIYAWLYEKCWRKQTRHSNLSKFISSAALKDLALHVHHIELTWSSSGPVSM